ncbi:hypothetical protein B0O99DRAFT_683919 [Bisporella sp. PMI_857]|nr:hypothetical protein B0O99DRAFT_683919 [Bisporella sp. PMI_857]
MDAQNQKPRSEMVSGRDVTKAVVVRDQFTITTWLLLGAAIQAVLALLPIKPLYAMVPAVSILLWRSSQNVLMTYGLLENTYMKGVITGKFTALPPLAPTLLPHQRLKAPMGLLAPGAREIAAYFASMQSDLEASAASYGFLGGSVWLNATSRSTRSEILTTFYFRSAFDVHAFAHSKVHRDGWDWWNREIKKGGLSYLSITHETYDVPAGKWESIYGNSHPTSLSATTFPFQDKEGKTIWRSPIVDASRGKYRSHKGRMGVTMGDDNALLYENADPYASKI